MTFDVSDSTVMPKRPPKIPRPTPFPAAQSPMVAALIAQIDANITAAKQAETEFWSTITATPLLEPADNSAQTIVTFLCRDNDAENILLFANRLTDETNLSDTMLTRIPRTDTWYLTVQMPSDWRATYCFLHHKTGTVAPWMTADGHPALRKSLDHGTADPHNPESFVNRAGVKMSLVELPAAPDRSVFSAPSLPVPEHISPDGRRCWIYTPDTTHPTPLLLVLDGDAWAGSFNLPAALDALIKNGTIPPVTACFIDSVDRDSRWADLLHSGDFPAYVAGPLLDWLRASFNVSHEAKDTVIIGQSLGGLVALQTTLLYPQRVARTVAQSPSLWADDCATALDTIVASGSCADVDVHLHAGALEWALLPGVQAFAACAEKAGVRLRYSQFTGGHDFAWWGPGIVSALVGMFGADL